MATPDRFDEAVAGLVKSTKGGGPGIEMLIGMIGSGKSTYARKRAKAGAVVVCHDDLIKALHPAGPGYDRLIPAMYHEVEDAAVRAALRHGRRVVIDRTNLTAESRERWYDIAEACGVPIVAVRFATVSPDEHARRRFEANPCGLTLCQWEGIADAHAMQLERSPFVSCAGTCPVVDVDPFAEARDPFTLIP